MNTQAASMNTDEVARLIALLQGETPTPSAPAATWPDTSGTVDMSSIRPVGEPINGGETVTNDEIAEIVESLEEQPKKAPRKRKKAVKAAPVVDEEYPPLTEADAPFQVEVSEEERVAIEEAIVSEIVQNEAAVEAEVIAEIQLDALKAEIYESAPVEQVQPETVSTEETIVEAPTPAPRARTKRTKFALDDTGITALMAAMGTDESEDLALEAGQGVPNIHVMLQGFKDHKNKKQRERIVNVYHWLGGKGDLRIFTKQALDLVLDLRNGIKKSDLTAMYKSHGYAEKTAASQVSHYWALLQLMRCADLAADGTLYKNDESLILQKRAQELTSNV
jgi:hypothetical protein